MVAWKFWKMRWRRSGRNFDGIKGPVRISLIHTPEKPMTRRAILLYAGLMAVSFVLLIVSSLDAFMV